MNKHNMNILLLNMPIRFNSWQNLEMPLGVAYIASELERQGYSVCIRDYEVEVFRRDRFAEMIKKIRPEVVGISFRSSSYTSAKTICSLIKEINPHICVVLGGQHASAFPLDTLKDISADFLIRGEGEYAMVELLEEFGLKKNFSRIAGLTYRNNGKLISNIPRENIADLDRLEFPAWHLLPIEKYVIGSILTSRGCPFACIYCDKSVSTSKVRFRSIENIYEEITKFENKYKKGRLYFVDDYFFLNKKRLREFFLLILKNGDFKFRWFCQARVDGVSDIALLRQAKESGCEMVIYGVETGDEQELKYINKKTTLEEAGRSIKLTKKAGIKTRANFMIGFPISTAQTIKNTIRFAKELEADVYRFFIVTPLPNTVLWDRVKEVYPEISQLGWDKFDFYSAYFGTLEISKDDLIKYVLAAYIHVLSSRVIKELSIYLLPRIIKLLYLSVKKGRIRGNLSIVFPACVNFFLEEWFILRRLELKQRLPYLKDAFTLAKRLKTLKIRG